MNKLCTLVFQPAADRLRARLKSAYCSISACRAEHIRTSSGLNRSRQGVSPGGSLLLAEGQRLSAELSSHMEQDIERVLRLRRDGSDVLGAGLFSNPAWDMLLQLSAARLQGRRVGLSDLITDGPESTRARWATILEERGLRTVRPDARAPSGLRVELSECGAAKMSRLARGLRHRQPID